MSSPTIPPHVAKLAEHEAQERAARQTGTTSVASQDAPGSPRAFEDEVTRAANKLRVQNEARRRVAAETNPAQPFDAALLCDIVDDPVRWLIEGLLPRNGRMTVVAIRKSGKTTWILTLTRALVRGEPFLGRFPVRAPVRRVAILNFEVSGAQLGRWALEIGIPGDRLLIINLRGKANPFANAEALRQLAALLRKYEIDVLIVDPFGRAFSGQDQNSAAEVGAWLAELDRLATEAGCSEVILAVHAGWHGEKTRGSTALEDWPDTIAQIVRSKEDQNLRYFKAFGRDVDVEEDALVFDKTTRRLTLAGSGSRNAVKAERRADGLLAAVVAAVTKEPGLTTTRLGALLREVGLGLQRGDAGGASRAAAEAGLIVRVPGKRGSIQHFLPGDEPDLSRPIPTYPGGTTDGVTTGLFPTPPIGGGSSPGLVGLHDDAEVPGILDQGGCEAEPLAEVLI